MIDEPADPLEVAEQIDRMLSAVPVDDTDAVDKLTRARLEGYVAGLRDGVKGATKH